jgi:glycosyltransferase involved in cell wall biosynthesis
LRTSLIIPTRNRRVQLAASLERLPVADMVRHGIELVLVDSASDDGTSEVMRDFAGRVPFAVRIVRVEQPGAGRARNHGIVAASGELLAFIDDDCYVGEAYFDRLAETVAGGDVDFGGGTIERFDPTDAAVGFIHHKRQHRIPPQSLIPAGLIQGSNMFFRRIIFDRAGGFRSEFGAGTPYPVEDIEMATRASLAGFNGILSPEVKVYHHHRRRPNSPELWATIEAYDVGRGAYYASLVFDKRLSIWDHWRDDSVMEIGRASPGTRRVLLRRLQREFSGAASFLATLLELEQKGAARAELPPPPAPGPQESQTS